jgi:hypothetical protein
MMAPTREPERGLCRAQAEHTDEGTADDPGEHRLVGAVDQPQHPAEQRHQQGAAEDAVPERLRLGGAPPDAGDRFGGGDQRRTDHGTGAGPDALNCIAEHGAGRCAKGRTPEQRVDSPAGGPSSGSARIPHDG